MDLLFQQFSLYPTMLISMFGIDMLRARPKEDFKTLEANSKKVCFIEFATFPLAGESMGLGLLLDIEGARVIPAFMRFQIMDDGEYILLQYIEIKDEEYRDKFNGDFRSSMGEVLREIE